MIKMFKSLKKIKVLDLSSFSYHVGSNYTDMFKDCENCYKLKGGNGTTYNPSNISTLYAYIDIPSRPGYFTYKSR